MSLSIDATTWRTPNIDPGRTITPRGICIHSCESTRFSSLPWLCNPASGVSCHYYVCRDGDVFQLADDTRRTWHAGAANYDGLVDWNTAIGLEFEHKAGQDWPAIQRTIGAQLCRDLIARWSLPKSRIAAHRWVATPRGRKIDPTDWPDPELIPWINALYTNDPFAGWNARGFRINSHERDWTAARAWLANPWLGACISYDLQQQTCFVYARDASGALVLLFERGAIVQAAGRAPLVTRYL